VTQTIAIFTIVVPDYDAGIDFYVNALGFELLEDTPRSPTKRWVRVAPKGAETAILLAKADGPAQDAAIGNQTGGRVGFFLHTDDFERDYQAMKAKGVTFKEAPRHEAYGSVVVFQDPWGNLWDLIEPKSM
jgi:catechol 2,3-dioxygenase-like lactoylglutathione lyase family enzyme